MTRPLRRAHFRIWLVLALLLPVVIATAVVARRTTTPVNTHFISE